MNTRALDIAAVVTDDPEGFDVPEALVVTGFYEISGKQLALSSRVALASGEPLRLEGPVTGPATNANEALLELSDRIAVVADGWLSDPGSWTSEGHRASALPALTAPLPKWDAWREAARAEAHGARGEWGRALESLQRAVDIDPDFTAAHLRLALQYGNTGDWKMADSILSTVRARADDLNPLQRVNLDWLTAAMANDRQERLRLHRQNLALMGRTDDLQLAHELISLNRPREALEVLARLDEEDMLRNGVERFWTFHARAHHLLGDHEEELAATRTGSERFPSHLAVMRYEASALGAMGRVEELQALVEAAFSAPAHGGCCPTRVPLNGGLELLAHGHPEAARRLLERGADLHALRRQNTERESARHAEILLAAERWEEAAAILEELGAARPDKVAYVGGLGIIAARTGDRAGAARIFDELDPSRFFGMDQPVAVLFRARIAAAMGEDERAMQLLMDGTAAGLAVETALPQPEFVRLRSTEAFRRWAEPVG
jgi:tetratricopeptide (TPR) repeat protein